MTVPIASIIAQIGIPVIADAISKSVNKIDHPIANTASKALGDLSELLVRGDIPPEQIKEANRHVEKMTDILIQERGVSLSEINKSLRSEVSSDDKYVRRMRPTFGYLMAITWAVQMFAIAYIIIFETSKAHIILQAMESLGTIWAVALSVLGIYVYKRSDDKRIFPNHRTKLTQTNKEKIKGNYND